MTRQSPVLLDVLSEIPDFRQSQGRRHPLQAVLALAVYAMLCGYRSYGAMAEWGRNYGTDLIAALGFTQAKTPCAATLNAIFRQLDRVAVESKLGQWAHSLLERAAGESDDLEAIAIDGKTLRGSRRQGAPAAHLLSALGHRLGVTLCQHAVADKTNEITAVHEVLSSLVLAGRVITVDALLTQREVAQTVTDRGGDYLMVVKGNQATLQADLQLFFEDQRLPAESIDSVETLEAGHGRIEQRRLRASTALCGYSDWPGLHQVFEITRSITRKRTAEQRTEVVYGVTSLCPEQADAGRLLELSRHHWHIENKSHWVRDVTFDEDRSQVRSGSIPQVMAALRNTAIGLMRCAGETNMAAGCRRFAAQPWSALALIGITQKTE